MFNKIFLLTFLAFSLYAESGKDTGEDIEVSKWKKHLDLVNVDIATINQIRSKDVSIFVRLLELYGEQLDLYIERENYLLITTGKRDGNEYNQIQRLKTVVYSKLLSLSDDLLKKTNDPAVKAKVYYYKAENAFNLKKYSEFYSYIKMAEKLSKDESLNRRIYQRIGDYHFNNQKFLEATSYYVKLLSDDKDKWSSKYAYNLAWCYLKQNDFEQTINYFKFSIEVSKRSGFFNIGEQAINSIMFAFALSKRELEGYEYLQNEKLIDFKRAVSYLDLVFEHGRKELAVNILDKVEKEIKTFEDYSQYIISYIVVNRNQKRFKSLNEFILSVYENKYMENVKQLPKDVVTNVRSYAGYLQELLGNKSYLNQNVRSALQEYSINSFGLLKKYDPENAIEYAFFQGEVSLSSDKLQQALGFYKEAIEMMANPILYKRADDLTEKVFQSMFRTVELLENSSKELVYTYTKYIKYGKNGDLKISVYNRYINYLLAGQSNLIVDTLKQFYKSYPSERESQVKYYKIYVNDLIKASKPDEILALYSEAQKGFLSLGVSEVDRLLEVFKNLILSRIDNPKEELSYEKKISLLDDLKEKYSVNSKVQNELFIRYLKVSNEHYKISNFVSYLDTYKKFLEKNRSLRNITQLSSYTNILCNYDFEVECLQNIVYLSKIYGFTRIERRLKEMYFILHLSLQKLDGAYVAASYVKKEFPDFDYLNPMLRTIALMDASDVFNFLESSKILNEDLSVILDTMEDHLIYKFVRNQSDYSYLKRCKKLMSDKCNTYENIITSYKKFKDIDPKYPLDFKPIKDITFEIFAPTLSSYMQLIQEQTKLIEENIKNLDPRLQSLGLMKAINYYENLKPIFSKYVPDTKDEELKKAILGELSNINSVFDKKIVEYKRSSQKIRSKIVDNAGSALLGVPLTNRDEVANETGKFLFFMDGI